MKLFKYEKHLYFLKNLGISFSFIVIFSTTLSAQTNSLFNGNWSDLNNWSAFMPNNTSAATVNHRMNLNLGLTIGSGAVYTVSNSGAIIDQPGGAAYSILIQQQGPGGILEVDGKVEIEGTLVVQQQGSLIVRSGDTLITGNAMFMHDAVIIVEEFAVMIVNGNLEMKQKNTVNLDGNLYVNGDINASQQSEMTGSGKVQATGTIDLGGTAIFFGNTSPCSPGPCEYGTGSGLPIELVSFKASHDNFGKVNINWITASEINNDYFIIEKSTDGFIFNEIERVKGNGTVSTFQDYSMNTMAEPVVTYYRLTQVDYNGSSKTFNPVALAPSEIFSNTAVKIYPNPAKLSNLLTVELQNPSDFVSLEIRDMSGKLIFQGVDPKQIENVQLDSKFESGIYIVSVLSKNGIHTDKLIVSN